MIEKIRTALRLFKEDRSGIPFAVFRNFAKLGAVNFMSDKEYIEIMYYLSMRKKLCLDNPKGFNEKLQWLKLHDRKYKYIDMVDKYKVRNYIASKIGEEYLIPLIGRWKSVEEMEIDNLPNQFVLKCNHDSGSVIVCKDKSKFDFNAAKKILAAGMKRNGFWYGREWPYKYVDPCIIAEKYMVDDSGDELKDYKFMCFNGKHKCTFTCTERFKESGLKVTFFDKDWNVMPFERHYPKSTVPIKKPLNYDKMVKLAEVLAKGIPFLRVDFYEVQGKIYFGELTFYPGAGWEEFEPEKWDEILGSWIDLGRV